MDSGIEHYPQTYINEDGEEETKVLEFPIVAYEVEFDKDISYGEEKRDDFDFTPAEHYLMKQPVLEHLSKKKKPQLKVAQNPRSELESSREVS